MRAAKGDLSMKLGVFTPVFGLKTLDQVLKKLRSLPGVSAIELATGGWPGSSHVDVDALLANPHKASDFRSQIQDAGLTISSLSCPEIPCTQIAPWPENTMTPLASRCAWRATQSSCGSHFFRLPGR
jgi:sugar phosphate isomerase/epimerase